MGPAEICLPWQIGQSGTRRYRRFSRRIIDALPKSGRDQAFLLPDGQLFLFGTRNAFAWSKGGAMWDNLRHPVRAAHNTFGWRLNEIVQDVPEEVAICEFDCNVRLRSRYAANADCEKQLEN